MRSDTGGYGVELGALAVAVFVCATEGGGHSATLTPRERQKLACSSDGDFARFIQTTSLLGTWARRPPNDLMLCEVELSSIVHGIDLAATWLVLREEEEGDEEEGGVLKLFHQGP